jgi:phospholipid-binding lipoprotein MlaA
MLGSVDAMGRLRIGLCAFLLLLASGCAGMQPEADGANDPFEPLNRGLFAFNRTLDGLILKPAARIYRGVVPEIGREGVHNVLANWTAPVTFLNDVLQGEPDRASETLGRFFLNTGFGLLGLLDVATYVGAEERHDEDFGQTLAVWGFGEGPYLVIPVIGPSNARDLGGRIADFFGDPVGIAARDNDLVWEIYARHGVDGIDTRARLMKPYDDLESGSLDFYAALRNFYRQRRDAEIRNNAPPPASATPKFDMDDDEPPAKPK